MLSDEVLSATQIYVPSFIKLRIQILIANRLIKWEAVENPKELEFEKEYLERCHRGERTNLLGKNKMKQGQSEREIKIKGPLISRHTPTE